jgi:hypothetical protein
MTSVFLSPVVHCRTAMLKQYAVEPRYIDIGLHYTSPMVSDILWYQSVPHGYYNIIILVYNDTRFKRDKIFTPHDVMKELTVFTVVPKRMNLAYRYFDRLFYTLHHFVIRKEFVPIIFA